MTAALGPAAIDLKGAAGLYLAKAPESASEGESGVREYFPDVGKGKQWRPRLDPLSSGGARGLSLVKVQRAHAGASVVQSKRALKVLPRESGDDSAGTRCRRGEWCRGPILGEDPRRAQAEARVVLERRRRSRC